MSRHFVPAFRQNFVKVTPDALMNGECGISATYSAVGELAGPNGPLIWSSTAPAINPVTQAVALHVGTFTTTIPPGYFQKIGGLFPFVGVIGGVRLQVLIAPTGTLRYGFFAVADRASLTGTTSPVPVMLTIGNDTGMTSATALFIPLNRVPPGVIRSNSTGA